MCAPRRCATPSGTARTCGWSTSTTCPRCRGVLRPLARLRRPGPLRRHRALDPGRPGRASSPRTASTCGGGRVLMLAHARVLGYVFNPLTVYWCHDADGAPVCVVAEVHNTYGERHCYLLRTDARGRARRQGVLRLAVLPGRRRYRMRLPEPGERPRRCTVQPATRATGAAPFTATVRGTRQPATTGGCWPRPCAIRWSTAGGRRSDPPCRASACTCAACRCSPAPATCTQEGMK